MKVSNIKSQNLKLLAFIFTSLLLVVGSKFLVRGVAAQIPPPAPIPCSSTGDPEFHSLRPYQASPCQVSTNDYAKFCGNTLTLEDKIDVPYRPGIDNCSPISGGKVRCSYVKSISEKITIDLSNAKLPIMGNTENVPNSQTPTGSPPPLSDTDKVNGYVSWYLNGVTNRAEDDSSKNTNDYNIVNLSGPLNKLLPSAISDAQRIKAINNNKVTNHDQIVVCASSNWGVLGDIVGIGSFKPIPCYTDLLEKNLRLSDWQSGGLSLVNTIANAIGDITPSMFKGLVGNQWNHRFPPLPWDDGTGKPFANGDLYQKAYSEWRGNSCITVPVINKTLCINNPLVSDKWADLFPYIPLSSTEDVEGNIKIDSVSVGGPEITNVSFGNQAPATLFFPHLTESDQLGSALQDTYIASGGVKTGSDTAVEPPSSCTTVDVRSNNGDNLFAKSLSGNLSYTATFTCDFNSTPTNSCSGECFPNRVECTDSGGKVSGSCGGSNVCCILPGPKPTPQPPQTCSKTVSIALSTSSNTPKIDDIWSRLVAGPTAVVKRMFPKLGTQIGTLKDMPGSTSVTYTGANASSGNLNLPHVGGISEYFLKGIQTLLRPKGYGEPVSFGPATENIISCVGGVLPTLPAANGSCKLNNLGTLGSANLSNLPTLVSIVEAASQTYNVPPGLILGVMFGEGAFNIPGRYDWTEDNVRTWSCTSMPNCSPISDPTMGVVPFFQIYWNGVKDAVNVVAPNREPNPCNLMDAIFALAKTLNQGQNGSPAFSGKTCYGIPLNAGSGASGGCSWDNSDYETAYRVWTFGTAYNGTATCSTKPGSCVTGGGFNAGCPGGDYCEKVGGSGNTSHNACVWDMAHNH